MQFLSPEQERRHVTAKPNQPSSSARIPTGIWALGFVSMLMDVSSEMIHALLPVYLVTVLGTSMVTVGLIEGIAEATASITKIFSGALSDWLGKRKLLAALGYGLAAITKPAFPLAPTVGWLVAARFIDRVGKGIRGAPRDALVADIAPPELRGASFGLRQSLDTVGAFLGPLLAIALMWASADNFRVVFWVAVLPAFLSLALIVLAVEEPKRHADAGAAKNPLSLAAAKNLGGAYWRVVGIGVVFTLARFSEAFLILRAQDVGLGAMWVPAVLVLMNIVYALSAYPAGVLADRIDRTGLLGLGLACLAAADLALAGFANLGGVALGVILWGLHMGLTQGLFATLVADASPASLRGTAYGYFNLFTGIAMLGSSIIAGALWDALGPAATFLCSLALALLSLAGLLTIGRIGKDPGRER
ncbi:MFS transporter [Bradyrhizobium macuxiense]|uniref:MFS transporter n=1 Tax=Bradyrhizobium macuxiense TaxID=1755647 RepID=A0A120FQI4_9BRAD|nr:MFS transporter [Bradyrhizobium macuxiense]KWV58580.1 MFS transporter [Bradyrhizobium macuxiense]